MAPDPTTPAGITSLSETIFSRLLGGMSVFTMLMTVPQVLTMWFWYGLQKKDKNIYLPCVGWVGLDTAVIIGTVIYG